MENKPQRVIIDISYASILRVIGVILGMWVLYHIQDIVALLFIVLIIVMALSPIVDRWQKRMPRALAVGILLFLVIAVITLAISLLVPPLIDQVSELAYNLPQYANQLRQAIAQMNNGQLENINAADRTISAISSQLSALSSGLVQATIGVLGGFVTFLSVLVLSAYLLFEEKGIRNFFLSLLPLERKEQVANAADKVGLKLGAWLRSQLILMLTIGSLTSLWAIILGLPYSLALGLWAGLTEVIPFIGPIIGGVPFVLIALLSSPIKALIALVLLIITQQTEANFIVPKIMQRNVGLSPVIVILALLIGGKLFGIIGTILAVPLAAALSVIIQEWPQLSRAKR